MVTETLRIACVTCEGSGKHRHSDRERERALGGSGIKLIGKAMAVITGQDIATHNVTVFQLERT